MTAPSQCAALALALALAWWIDARWGEPRAAWHPVVWMGSMLSAWGPQVRALGPRAAFLAGALVWCFGAVLAGGLAAVLQAESWSAWAWAAVPLWAMLLKPMFARRMLLGEVRAVESALHISLAAGRERLARLVSRDVSQLEAHEVREAAIETLAENLNDSVVAPLCWFVVAGLPGAMIYRWANTADAMWGYRGEWEWAGKWAARADDLLSWLPARLTAALLRPSLGWAPWRALADQASRTPSPNGGWPMGAMALALGLRLSKPGVYELNPGGRAPGPHDLHGALVRADRAARAALGTALLALLLRAAWERGA